ncbi:MAG: nuclear transport factor 2 family protein [Pseudomonadota bacterium]
MLLTMERRVWDALVAGDAAADRALLSDGFLGVYPSGFAAKSEHSGQLDDGPSVASYDLSEVTVRAFSPDLALIAYCADFARSASPERRERMYVTSIWSREDGGWINVFSQDTPAETAP